MDYMYKKEQEKSHSILSATKPKEPILSVNSNQKEQLKTVLKQKKKIIVYVKDKKYFVEHATAFALGLINTRAIMLDEAKLVEISYDIHNKLVATEDIEIEYLALDVKKEKLKVFVNESSYYIENSSAFSLGLLTVEEFNNVTEKYYCISESMLPFLQSKYDVEMYALNLFEDKNNKLI